MIPIFFFEHIFNLLVADVRIAYLAALYCKIVAPGMLLFFIGADYAFLAASMGVTHFGLVTNASASLFHYCCSYVLCKYYHWGMYGIAISTFLHFVVRLFVPIYLAQINEKTKKCLIPLSDKDSWTGFPQIIKLAGVQIMVSVMGWWAFDVFTLLASLLRDTDIAA